MRSESSSRLGRGSSTDGSRRLKKPSMSRSSRYEHRARLLARAPPDVRVHPALLESHRRNRPRRLSEGDLKARSRRTGISHSSSPTSTTSSSSTTLCVFRVKRIAVCKRSGSRFTRRSGSLFSPFRNGRSTSIGISDPDRRNTHTHGHQSGDSAPRTYANLLTDSAREEDVVARWGGGKDNAACSSNRSGDGCELVRRSRLHSGRLVMPGDRWSCPRERYDRSARNPYPR